MIVVEGSNTVLLCDLDLLDYELKYKSTDCQEKSVQLNALNKCGDCALFSLELECMDKGNTAYEICLGETVIQKGEFYFG